ncbi:hypothetical protein EC844_102232 [Acinetobacter calcoaceticus]|uniref:Lipoprotein n=1 Tax=Acinetobacter calcoaceticus TaxID=471 RepID=A0A4R1Y191_ACICA|nr:hypothetical protein EC844_102232 [Acinetobacter calcoaceticus]
MLTSMFKRMKSPLLLCGLASLGLTGCATSTLMNKDTGSYTTTAKVNLVEDTVVAFGKPAHAQPNLPSDSVVIAGQKNSYILTQGGSQFVHLITKLDPKNIQINKDLSFNSPKNDGNFYGNLPLTYVKLQQDISKADLEFFIQNGAEECTSSSDKRMNAQRFCFDIKLSGVVYPVANNVNSLQSTMKSLSKPYSVSIYTTQSETHSKATAKSGLQKLVLFPFAVAIDVITLPFQAAQKIFD